MSDLQMALCVGARSLPSHFLYLSQNDFHRRIDIGRESSVEQANIRFCLFNFPEKWRGRHLGTPSALSAKYYRWNSNTRRERGSRRKRISSISQRVAVTVSVMAFGSVVESYSCANPIRALLRVYFRTRVVCIHVGTHPKERWEYHKRFTVAST